MRIVVDTNVLVSACIGSGASSRLVEACLRGRIKPVLGGSLLLEYRDVMSREPLFVRARLNAAERALLLRAFVSCCQWQDVSFTWRPNLRDEADNHVFELAIAANGATIITNNIRDFHRPELKFPHLRTETPDAFLNRTRT